MLIYPEDAEEAAQDALLLVATKIGSFAGRSKFTTWLHSVASNSARSTYRTLKRRSAERPTDELPSNPDPRTTSVIAGSRLDLLEALETIGTDHPELVEPLVLRDVQQLDYAEIARLLAGAARHGEVAHPHRPSRGATAARRPRLTVVEVAERRSVTHRWCGRRPWRRGCRSRPAAHPTGCR